MPWQAWGLQWCWAAETLMQQGTSFRRSSELSPGRWVVVLVHVAPHLYSWLAIEGCPVTLDAQQAMQTSGGTPPSWQHLDSGTLGPHSSAWTAPHGAPLPAFARICDTCDSAKLLGKLLLVTSLQTHHPCSRLPSSPLTTLLSSFAQLLPVAHLAGKTSASAPPL